MFVDVRRAIKNTFHANCNVQFKFTLLKDLLLDRQTILVLYEKLL
jgi:hypothetical protein